MFAHCVVIHYIWTLEWDTFTVSCLLAGLLLIHVLVPLFTHTVPCLLALSLAHLQSRLLTSLLAQGMIGFG